MDGWIGTIQNLEFIRSYIITISIMCSMLGVCLSNFFISLLGFLCVHTFGKKREVNGCELRLVCSSYTQHVTCRSRLGSSRWLPAARATVQEYSLPIPSESRRVVLAWSTFQFQRSKSRISWTSSCPASCRFTSNIGREKKNKSSRVAAAQSNEPCTMIAPSCRRSNKIRQRSI